MESDRAQLLIRIPTDHALLVKRMAARESMTVTDYVHKLIVADIEAKADAIRAEIDSWREQAMREAEALASRETAAVENVIHKSAKAG